MNQFYNKTQNARHSVLDTESTQDSRAIVKLKEILNQVQDDVGAEYV